MPPHLSRAPLQNSAQEGQPPVDIVLNLFWHVEIDDVLPTEHSVISLRRPKLAMVQSQILNAVHRGLGEEGRRLY